jgi:hypothetical protein
MRRDNQDLIFENYQSFLRDNKHDYETPNEFVQLLTENNLFDAYIETLIDRLPEDAQVSVRKVADLQRELLLTENMYMGPSANTIGYAVTYFPILTDIYADPVLSQIATTYTTTKPVISIPRMRVYSSVKQPDGSISTFIIPRVTVLARGVNVDLAIPPSDSTNLFILLNNKDVIKENSRINKRFIFIKQINILDKTNGPTTTPTPLSITVRPDSRGGISYSDNYTALNGSKYTYTVSGNINWDSSITNISVSFEDSSGNTVNTTDLEVVNIIISASFSPTTGDVGRVKTEIKTEIMDISIDTREEFEVELQTESIQDYRDIYNVDMIRMMSLAIKQQMLLNKDFDLNYFLQANEPIMKKNDAYRKVDLQNYTNVGQFNPNTIIHIYQSIIPAISYVARKIHLNFRASPQYIVCGVKTATMLETLQDFAVQMPAAQYGDYGFNKSMNVDFRKMTIIPAYQIQENKIYLVFKAPQDDLARTAIADIIYKPLYVVESIDSTMRKTFFKSRTAIEVTNPDALGLIEVVNYQGLI